MEEEKVYFDTKIELIRWLYDDSYAWEVVDEFAAITITEDMVGMNSSDLLIRGRKDIVFDKNRNQYVFTYG